MTRVRAYWRARGWLAWHTAWLGRVDPKHFPSLGELTGEGRTQAGPQSPDQMLHTVRLWKATLKGSGGDRRSVVGPVGQ